MAGMTMEDFKREYPDIYGAIYDEGQKYGRGFQNRMKKEMTDLDKSKPQNSVLPVEERAKASWDSDPALRSEFMDDFSSWKAFYIADQNNQVHILGRKAGAK